MTFPTRVAEKAADVQVAKLLLSLVALPFYLAGLVVGVLIVVVKFAWAGVAVGINDVRARADAR